MTGSSPAMSLEHRLRLRELAKYYCVASPLLVKDVNESNGFSDDDFIPQPPKIAKDQQLTALAQLAAFRLNCQRCFISIIDDKHQHVIAEATRSVSVCDQDDHDDEDALLIGAQSLPLDFGICPMTMGVFEGGYQLQLDNLNNRAGKDHIVIEDLLAEETTKHRPCVHYFPNKLRYYVEVPLCTDSGYLVGSICVIDSKPAKFNHKHIAQLKVIAKLVVSQLDLSRMKEDHHRAERLLEGLAHFLHGKDSLSDWSKAAPGQENIPNVYPHAQGFSFDKITAISKSSSDLPDSSTISSPVTTITGETTEFVKHSDPSQNTITPATSQTATEIPTAEPSSTGIDIEIGFDPLPENDPREPHDRPVLASVATRHAFSKASNLLREAMGLDATCFLEVPQNERFKNPRKKAKSSQSDLCSESTSSFPSISDSSSDISASEINPKDDSEASSDQLDACGQNLCHRLGFSTRIKSSLARSTTTNSYLTIPASLLSQLTAKYPSGHIFHFDAVGSISSGDDSSSAGQDTTRRSSRKKKKLSVYLSHHFPTARSLIFYPLYDNDKQQIFAGFLGWTTDPARALQTNEITYVSGFANSIMCEVMRIEALAMDKTKSDFMSSISHELRSPLHGILAAYQLLTESELRPEQTEFLSMIDTCARSLLDVMDHLLDYTKINHFTQRHKESKRKKGSLKSRSKSNSLVTEIDLLSIVEETTAAMAASSIQSLSPESSSPQDVDHSAARTVSTSGNPPSPVPIILNVANNRDWSFTSEAGSWRRIIMNLIGNSLKYTQHGHITVSLSLQAKSTKRLERTVRIKVSDTGRGISDEYLKHRLYTPFAQENNLSVGTGLGLSLVHQIVTALGGEINVHSEVGYGTDILIQIPLRPSPSTGVVSLLPNGKDDHLQAMCNGKSFEFYGFEDPPSIYQESTGMPSPRTKALISMKASISAYLGEWFGLYQKSTHPDVLVVEKSYLNNNLETFDVHNHHLIVIGLDGRSTAKKKISNANYVYMLPPIGPREVARTLDVLFGSGKKIEQAHMFNVPDSSTTRTDGEVLAESDQESEVHKKPPTLTTNGHANEKETLEVANVACSETTFSETLVYGTDLSRPRNTRVVEKEAILLVDDNEINLRILESCIKKLNLSQVVHITATNGKEALDQYTSALENGTRISIIFMDISMPVMDGYTATRKIRALERRQNKTTNNSGYAGPTQIIALTGLASEAAQNEVENSGFDQYFRKPVNLKTVRDLVLKHCSQI